MARGAARGIVGMAGVLIVVAGIEGRVTEVGTG